MNRGLVRTTQHNKMKTKTLARGFTLIELLVVISIIAMLAAGAYAGYGAMLPGIKAKNSATKAGTIYKWLVGFALDNGGSFPMGQTANLALRELFKSDKYGADEMQFYIEGDAYHNAAPGKKPDGDKGRAPDFEQALQPGENAYAYVSGLTNADEARLPLLANGFTAGSSGIWTNKKGEKGGVFQGKYAVVCRVGGSCAAHQLDDNVYELKEKKAGGMVNIFSPDFFETTVNVVNPD